MPPSAAPRLPPRRPRTCCTLYEARSRAASGNVGVDALRHAWRDCAKGSHFNHCSRACVGCSHEVKRVRRPLFFFLANDRRDDYLLYLQATLPPHLAPTYGRKNTLSHLPMSLSSSTGVLLPYLRYIISSRTTRDRLGSRYFLHVYLHRREPVDCNHLDSTPFPY